MGLMPLEIEVAALMQVTLLTSPKLRVPPAVFSDLAYPVEALSRGQAGVVVLSVTTNDNGHVVSAEGLTGPAALVRAAVDNVKT
jgi:outer membrane biosynthesis protein TonB